MKRNLLSFITQIPIQFSYLLLLIALTLTLMTYSDYSGIIIDLLGEKANISAVTLTIIAITLITTHENVKNADFVISVVLSAITFHLAGYNELIAIVSSLIAIISIAKQINSQQEISEAQFIFDINDKYVNNDDYKNTYVLLDTYQNMLDRGASTEELEEQEKKIDSLSNSQISNYLTFFEVLNILLKKDRVSIELLDDLFAYRFFIAVRNPVIYRRKLKHGNFANIRELHDLWIKYRENKTLETGIEQKIYGIQCYE